MDDYEQLDYLENLRQTYSRIAIQGVPLSIVRKLLKEGFYNNIEPEAIVNALLPMGAGRRPINWSSVVCFMGNETFCRVFIQD